MALLYATLLAMSANSVAPGAQQQRFAAYLDRLAQAAGHLDRAVPVKFYCTPCAVQRKAEASNHSESGESPLLLSGLAFAGANRHASAEPDDGILTEPPGRVCQML